MPSHGETISSDRAKSWDKFLDEFDQKIYPTFAKHRYTKGVALQVFMLNHIDDELIDLVRIINEDKYNDD